MAVAVDPVRYEPQRVQCAGCGQPVIMVAVEGELLVASAYEWLPRMPCRVCRWVKSRRGTKRAQCTLCDGSGYVGEKRPAEVMVAIDIAWGDDCHVRLVTPRMVRRKGEGLFRLHPCGAQKAAVRRALHRQNHRRD